MVDVAGHRHPADGHDNRHGHDHDHDHDDDSRPVGRLGSAAPLIMIGLFVLAFVVRSRWSVLTADDVRVWATLFVSISLQAFPFLVLGVVLSGLIAAFVSPELVERMVPRNPYLAVPAAGSPALRSPVASADRSRSRAGSSQRAPRPPLRSPSCSRRRRSIQWCW